MKSTLLGNYNPVLLYFSLLFPQVTNSDGAAFLNMKTKVDADLLQKLGSGHHLLVEIPSGVRRALTLDIEVTRIYAMKPKAERLQP